MKKRNRKIRVEPARWEEREQVRERDARADFSLSLSASFLSFFLSAPALAAAGGGGRKNRGENATPKNSKVRKKKIAPVLGHSFPDRP